MGYISSRRLSEKWGISQRRIVCMAQNGQIDGAKLYGRSWLFPEDAQKPQDRRTKAGKTKKKPADSFRFPSFEFRDISSFDPPLSSEELTLKMATEEYYACRAVKSDMLLGSLPETADDRYIRIAALYTGCMIDMYLCNTERFLDRYGRLQSELEEDFPHKEEMAEFLHTLDAALCSNRYYSREFKVMPDYQYHESFLPRLASLCAVSLSFADRKVEAVDLKSYEMNCILLKKSGALSDLQSLHLSLGIAYGMLGMRAETDFHIAEALKLAEEYEMYYPVAVQYYYTQNLFRGALSGFSEQFKRKLVHLSNDVKRHYLPFSDEIAACSIFKLLTRHDFIFMFYAVQGLTNSEIAKRMNVSESTVGNRFSDIYAALGIHGKRELIDLYRKTVGEKTEE